MGRMLSTRKLSRQPTKVPNAVALNDRNLTETATYVDDSLIIAHAPPPPSVTPECPNLGKALEIG